MPEEMICPNCEAEMELGDPCPECDHDEGDPDCECDYCDPYDEDDD